MSSKIFKPSLFDLRATCRAKDFNRKTGRLTSAGYRRLTYASLKAHGAIIRRMIRFHKLGMPLLLAVETKDFRGLPTLPEPITYGCFTGPYGDNLLLDTGPESEQGLGISWIHVARIQIVHPLRMAEGLNAFMQPCYGRRSLLEWTSLK